MGGRGQENETVGGDEILAAPRDAANWARHNAGLRPSYIPHGAINLNVEGREALGPLQGFGPMWRKVYRVRLDGVAATPAEVIGAWKQNFPSFWPRGHTFYAPLTGITPGEVALLNLSIGGAMPLSTGVLVLYADDESFTLMTPQGHMFAGWITFSANEEAGATVAQAMVLMRASDPMYELGLRLGGHRAEDRFWVHTLGAVAKHFGAQSRVEIANECLDRRVQWSHLRNIRHNAAMRTALFMIAAPIRWFYRRPNR
jgi:hypothetical protein